MANSSIDDNRNKTLIGVSSVDLVTPTLIASNPVTGAILIDGTSLYADLDPRYLQISNNLSDLNNAGTARTNLGLVAGGAGDIWVEKAGDTMTGNLLFTDNTLDIGASGATRPRTGYFGTSVVAPLFTGALTGAASLNVLKTGDSMSGSLTLDSTSSAIGIQFNDNSTNRYIFGYDKDSKRVKLSTGSTIGGTDLYWAGEQGTSYNNTGGKGNRTAIITPTHSGNGVWTIESWGKSVLLDGAYANANYFANGNTITSAMWMKWDFGDGYAPVIDEVTWYQSGASNCGQWKWQGSNNDSDWTDIGVAFELGVTATQLQTQLNGNTTGYRYYRLLGVSGSTNWGRYQWEIEFRIDTSFDVKYGMYYDVPVGFNESSFAAQFNMKTTSTSPSDYAMKIIDSNEAGIYAIRNDGKMQVGYGALSPSYNLDVLGEMGATGMIYVNPLAYLSSSSVANVGTAGSTTYTYKVIGKVGSRRGSGGLITTTTGNATLSGSNYNKITWGEIAGATDFEIWRTVGGGSTGVIGSVTALSGTRTFNDIGLTGGGESLSYPPNSGTGYFSVGQSSPFSPLSTAIGYPPTVTAFTSDINIAFTATSNYQLWNIDTSFIEDWTHVGGIFSAGNTTANQRNSYGIKSRAVGGYIFAIAGDFITTANGGATAYGLRVDVTGTSGYSAYGLYIKNVTSGTTNYAIYTNDGLVRFGDSVVIADGKNIQLDTTTGTKIGTATSQKLGFYNATPIVQPTEITDELTTITFTAPGTPDYAVQDLVAEGGAGNWGFATQDEGNTVLSVIANLQARVNELETVLSSLGLLADAD